MILRLILLSLCFAISGESRPESYQEMIRAAEGAQTGLEVKELIGAGSAEIVGRLVDVTLQPAVETAKTPAERDVFQETATFFKKTAFSVLALMGARHFLKGRPRGKAFSKPLKKVLERKVTVKDGIVYAGEKSLGPIKDMPTLRRFSKPKNAALRECFESDVFDREVAWRCNVDDRTYRIIKRNDIDPHRVVPGGKYAGKTNLDLMKQGLAPYNNAGQKVVLHHVNQKASGPFIETTRSAHTSELHGLFGPNKPHPTEPVHRGDFNKLREAYWRDYAESIK